VVSTCRLRNGDCAFLQTPRDADASRADAPFGGDTADYWVLEDSAVSERCVRHEVDVLRVAVVSKFFLGQQRVHLHLNHGDRNGGDLIRDAELIRGHVTNPSRSNSPVVQGGTGPESYLRIVFAGRPVDPVEELDRLDVQPIQTRADVVLDPAAE